MPGAFSSVILAGLGFFACGFVLAFWAFGRIGRPGLALGASAFLAAVAVGSGYALTHRVPALGPNPQGAPIAPVEISRTLLQMMWLAILSASAAGGAVAALFRSRMSSRKTGGPSTEAAR